MSGGGTSSPQSMNMSGYRPPINVMQPTPTGLSGTGLDPMTGRLMSQPSASSAPVAFGDVPTYRPGPNGVPTANPFAPVAFGDVPTYSPGPGGVPTAGSQAPVAFGDVMPMRVPQQPQFAPNPQVASTIRSFGQDPNSAFGQQLMQGYSSGQLSQGDLLKALNQPSMSLTATAPQAPTQAPMQTKGIVLSEGPQSAAARPANYFPYNPGGPSLPPNPGPAPTPTPGPGAGPGSPSPNPIPYNPYPGFPGLPPMPADNTPRFYGPSYLSDSITGKLFQTTPQIAQYMDALANNPNSFRF